MCHRRLLQRWDLGKNWVSSGVWLWQCPAKCMHLCVASLVSRVPFSLFFVLMTKTHQPNKLPWFYSIPGWIAQEMKLTKPGLWKKSRIFQPFGRIKLWKIYKDSTVFFEQGLTVVDHLCSQRYIAAGCRSADRFGPWNDYPSGEETLCLTVPSLTI